MDPTAHFDLYSFMQTGHLTVAMERHADVLDVFPGSRYVYLMVLHSALSDPSAPIDSVTRESINGNEVHPAGFFNLPPFDRLLRRNGRAPCYYAAERTVPFRLIRNCVPIERSNMHGQVSSSSIHRNVSRISAHIKTRLRSEMSTSRSSRINKYILFEHPEVSAAFPNICIYRASHLTPFFFCSTEGTKCAYCSLPVPHRDPRDTVPMERRTRYDSVMPDTRGDKHILIPIRHLAQFRIRVCALMSTYDPERPGTPMLQRGPEKVHCFTLRLRTSTRGLPIGP